MYFFDRAFRSFFLGGSLFAALSMWIWWQNYPISVSGLSGITPMYWHAHEMVFGYALATITGFLLTAVMNWTGSNSASGKRLAGLFVLWLSARIGYLINLPIEFIAILDIGFTVGLFLHFFIPIYQAKQWKQSGLAVKFFLLIVANSLYYAGTFGVLQQGMYWGVIAGLFLVLAINLTMMRRLIPFFTEKALGLPEKENSKWLDAFAIGGFLSLMIAAALFSYHWITALIAFPLALVHAIRWQKWYHHKIWKVTLLWPLHVSYAFMIFGMLLYGFVGLNLVSESLAVHALAAGGIGLLCSAIMARISLGHTNRNVFEPPKMAVMIFIVLTITAIVRVVLPMIDSTHYVLWMELSQWGWIIGFTGLSFIYWPILIKRSRQRDNGVRL
ncbi:MAG: NnrS family protein [Pseudomonadota bacterium]|nr:NnrS family protein [Pseudomonadota bacterium]